jgi:putative transposase
MSVSHFMGYLKGKSALMIFDKHPEYKKKGGNRHFWATGYYVDTVGRNEAQIKQYIARQSKSDRIEDNEQGVRSNNRPFKG